MPTRRLGPLLLQEQSAPSTPAPSYSLLYPKAGGGWYVKDDAGAERRIDLATDELYDSATIPPSPTYPYLRFERDVDGDVQFIYLGTAS